MTLATNLDQVYRACDPDMPLDATDDRYVDLSEVRGTQMLAKKFARRIGRCADNQFHQQLISGHRGCGKSTELLRLKAELEQRDFLVVYIDIEELLDLVNLEYLDILLSLAKQTTEVITNNGIELNETLLTELHEWFSDKIISQDKTKDSSGSLKTKASVGGKIPFLSLIGETIAEIKASSSRRETTRQNLKRELVVFLERLNALLGDARNAAQKAGRRDIVLIVDGLEKMHFEKLDENTSTHTKLFVNHAEQLKAPQCHIIYTMPISLAYEANLGNDFDDPEVIPMVKMNDKGIACLREVVAKRVAIETVFDDATFVDELAQLSGGVMRDLIRLIRLATDSDNPTIRREEIDYARNKLVIEYDRLLREDELEKLKWVEDNKRITGDQNFARMLFLRLVLEYQNGQRWATLHPALHQIRWFTEYLGKE